MKSLYIVIGILASLFVITLLVAGCAGPEASESENSAEDDGDAETGSSDLSVGTQSASQQQQEQQVTVTEEIIEPEQNFPEGPECGDGICDETELKNCEQDCPTCDDGDSSTEDSFDLETLKCKNIREMDYCGDEICSPDEECEQDCPVKRITLASYPYPFVHGDDLEAEIVVGDDGTAKEVTAATAIALGLGIKSSFYGTLASEISTIDDTNIILVGNPCTNKFIAELMPFTEDCLEDYEEGEGRISIFTTGMPGGKEKCALVVSGHSDDDIRRAAGILENYEFNMPKLKGTITKV